MGWWRCILNQNCHHFLTSTLTFSCKIDISKVYDHVDKRIKPCLPACNDQVNQIAYSKTNYPATLIPIFEDFCLLFVKLMTQCHQEFKKNVLDETYPALCVGILAMEEGFRQQQEQIFKETNFIRPGPGAASQDLSGKAAPKPPGKPPPPNNKIDAKNLPPKIYRDVWISRYCDPDRSLWTSLLKNYSDEQTFSTEMRR